MSQATSVLSLFQIWGFNMAYDSEAMKRKLERVGASRLPYSKKIEIYQALLNDARADGADEFECLDIVDEIIDAQRFADQFGDDDPDLARELNKMFGHKPKWWEYPLICIGL